MKNFIEVTEGKLKKFVAVDEIQQVTKNRKGKAVIDLIPRLKWLGMPMNNVIFPEESYEEVKEMITKASGAV